MIRFLEGSSNPSLLHELNGAFDKAFEKLLKSNEPSEEDDDDDEDDKNIEDETGKFKLQL